MNPSMGGIVSAQLSSLVSFVHAMARKLEKHTENTSKAGVRRVPIPHKYDCYVFSGAEFLDHLYHDDYIFSAATSTPV